VETNKKAEEISLTLENIPSEKVEFSVGNADERVSLWISLIDRDVVLCARSNTCPLPGFPTIIYPKNKTKKFRLVFFIVHKPENKTLAVKTREHKPVFAGSY